MKKFSATTGGFYDVHIHGDNIPVDAVEITDAEHAALLEGQSAGNTIASDAEGRPSLVAPQQPSNSELRAAELRALLVTYQSDMQSLQSAWVSALIADGESEEDRKSDIAAEMAEVKAQYLLDVASVKSNYPN